jgi:D-arabinose 1-dehydrogenase-like Zn-dependent alcohol dehydrogenase
MFVGGPVPVLMNLVTVGSILALGSDRKAGLLIVEQGPGRLLELMSMVAGGKLTPVVGEVARLTDAAKALGRMGRGEVAGKLVVVP